MRLWLSMVLVLVGCVGGEDGESTVTPDAGAGTMTVTPDAGTRTASPLAASGAYDVEGAWDLSAPIGGERTVGVVAAELVVEEAAALSGVPSELEDELRDALAAELSAEIETWVDARVPAALAPGSPLMTELGAVAAEVRYRGELELVTERGAVSGVERITHLAVEHEGTAYDLAVVDLPSATPGAVSLEADWSGAIFGSVLELEPYVVELRYGLLVLWLARDVLGEDVAALEVELREALACTALVDALLGGSSAIHVDLGVATVEIPATTLESACGGATEELSARALGLFATDTPVELEGALALTDGDRDGTAERLTSTTEHTGVLSIGGPRALSPQIGVRMTGHTR